ncbi:MAG: universal stress protein [Candidatus Gastranaerophilales bacterium]
MKVLFCTDGSKISFNALSNLANWASDIEVDVISVIDWGFLPDEVQVERKDFNSSCANVADDILDYATDKLQKLGLTAGKMIKHCGSVVESILEQTEIDDYDLVLLGSHGKKGIQKWLGSVSQEILNSSKNDIYISKEKNDGKRVLFATDGSVHAFEVIKKSLSIYDFKEKEIFICTVCEEPDLLFLEGTLDTNWLLSIQKRQQDFAQQALKEVQDLLVKNGLAISKSQILIGNPTHEIIEYAKTSFVDLVLMGQREKSTMDKFLMGSICKRVLENIECDMFIIKNN